MPAKTDTPLAPESSANGSINYIATNEGLRQENARLKDLVVQLSAIIAKNVAAQKKTH